MRKSLVVLLMVVFVLSMSVDAIAASDGCPGKGAQLKDGSGCGQVGQCDRQAECKKDCDKCEKREDCKKECDKKGASKGAGKGGCGKGKGGCGK
ncbi:MAG: hypothetical protein KAS23_09480 [Anaerohalosphaera sp.]|nr:hypothetical protein [Anaerohalosphaera sp.]